VGVPSPQRCSCSSHAVASCLPDAALASGPSRGPQAHLVMEVLMGPTACAIAARLLRMPTLTVAEGAHTHIHCTLFFFSPSSSTAPCHYASSYSLSLGSMLRVACALATACAPAAGTAAAAAACSHASRASSRAASHAAAGCSPHSIAHAAAAFSTGSADWRAALAPRLPPDLPHPVDAEVRSSVFVKSSSQYTHLPHMVSEQ
jgi:hypothetical protein